MTAKQYLGQIRYLNRQIEKLIGELEYLRQKMSQVSAIRYDKDTVQSSPELDPMGETYVQIEAKEKELADKLSRLVGVRLDIVSRIIALQDPRHVDVLYARYVGDTPHPPTWETIADTIGYSRIQTIRIHGTALEEFREMYGEELGLGDSRH